MDESEEDAEKDSVQQISDCESESYDEKPQDFTHKPANVSQLRFLKFISVVLKLCNLYNQQQHQNYDLQ